MMPAMNRRVALLAAIALSAGASAQNIAPEPAMTHARLMQMQIRVIREDITDHPYRVIAEVQADASQLTRFSGRPTNRKLAEELWDEARKLGADAVVNARYSDLETTGLTYGQRRAYGRAVKFLTPAEAEAWRTEQR